MKYNEKWKEVWLPDNMTYITLHFTSYILASLLLFKILEHLTVLYFACITWVSKKKVGSLYQPLSDKIK